MKKLLILTLMSLLVYRAADVFSDIGLTRPEAQQQVVNSITSGYISVPAACRKLTLAQRASVVSNIVSFAKAYTQTDDFKKRYANWRNEAKPTSSAKSYEQVQQEQREQIAGMKKTKAAMAKMDAATQKALQQAIKEQEKIVAELETGTSPMLMKRETVEQVNKYAEAEYQENLKKWEEDYPANPSVLIRKQLNNFLEQSNGIDFAAKLTDRNGKKYFVNPDYEQKPEVWKRCFRAGFDATATARQQAQSWLSELDKN